MVLTVIGLVLGAQTQVNHAARRAEATVIAKRIGTPKPGDLERLRALGEDAITPLLDAYLVADAEAKRKREIYRPEPQRTIARFLFDHLPAARTAETLATADRCSAKGDGRAMLFDVLAERGDPSLVAPRFVEELCKPRTRGGVSRSVSDVIRPYVVRSHHPAAARYVLRAFKDPTTDRELRQEAYIHLADTAGAEGLRVVLAARARRNLLAPLAKRALGRMVNDIEPWTKGKPLATKRDAQGVTWGLFLSDVLGDSGDLWIASMSQGSWTNAWFSGVTRSKRTSKTATQFVRSFHGVSVENLVAGAWFKSFVGSPELIQDSDGDGLTDLVEARLETDPHSQDSDGDGDPDGADPWPKVARHAQSDDEKILEAVFEAEFHDDQSVGPVVVVAPADAKPFEMVGRKGPSFWLIGSDARKSALAQRYGFGVGVLRFSSNPKAAWPGGAIQWNRDHTVARVEISLYFGGLNGTVYEYSVRRFGSTWVVVDGRMTAIS